jgi:cyclomaltodextrinase / maltogenic alpha-amylase / neopullulanase
MMSSKLLIFHLFAFIFTPFLLKSQTDRDVYGLITPVQLTDSATTVLLEDYFMDVRKIERVETIDGFKTDLSRDHKTLIIKPIGQNLPMLSNMEIILRGGKRQSFLLKTSLKKTVNAWNPNEGKLKKANGNWEITFSLNAGNYEYLFIADGIELKDPLSNLTSPNGKNSLLVLPKPNAAQMVGLFTKSHENEQISLGFRNKPTKIFAYWDNHLLILGNSTRPIILRTMILA